MAKEYKIKARIEAEDAASPVVDKVQSKFSKLSGYMKDHFVVTLGDVTRIFKSIVGVFGSAVDAAAEAEEGVKRLDNALASIGPNAKIVSAALQEQAAALQKVTKYEDDAIIAGQAFAAAFIKTEEGLKKVTLAAVDLAAGLGIDLETAFKLLTKASQGNTAALGRYGIVLDDTLTPAQKFAELQTLIASKFGGRAVADVDTYAGALAQLGNSYNDIQEAVGGAVTGSRDVRKALQALNETLQDEGVIRNLNDASTGIVNLGAAASGGTISSISHFSDIIRALGGDAEAGFRVVALLEALDSAATKGATSSDGAAVAMANLMATYRELAKSQQVAADVAQRSQEAQDRLNATDVKYQRNLATLVSAYESATVAAKKLNEATERRKRIAEDSAEAEGKIALAAKQLGVVLEGSVLNAINENNQAFKVLQAAGLDTAEVMDALRVANEALYASLHKNTDTAPWENLTAAQKRTAEVAKDLGIVLSVNVNNALYENQQKLVELTRAFNANEIGIEQWTVGTQALVTANQEMLDSIDGIPPAIDNSSQAMDVGSAAAVNYAGTLTGQVVPAMDRVIEKIAMSSQAFDALSASAGRAAAVQAALANGGTLSLGGNRIDLKGGGGRMTSSPGVGGSYGSQTRVSDSTSVTYIYNPSSGRIEKY